MARSISLETRHFDPIFGTFMSVTAEDERHGIAKRPNERRWQTATRPLDLLQTEDASRPRHHQSF